MDYVCVAIRVPKSGSTSMVSALRAAFADKRTFFLPDSIDPEGEVSPAMRRRFLRAQQRMVRAATGEPDVAHAIAKLRTEIQPGDLISGSHFTYAFACEAAQRPARIISLLRDPVSRCVSEYNYARQVHAGRGPIKKLLSKGRMRAAARYSLIGYLDWMLEHREAYGDVASGMIGWDGREPLDAYFEANVLQIGVLDAVDAFASGLSQQLGRPIDIPWQNTTTKRDVDKADSEARRRIERLDAGDFELYEYVRGLARP